MQTELPFFMLCMLIHAGIYLSSGRSDRRPRLMIGLVLLFLTPLLWFGGGQLAQEKESWEHWLGIILQLAPYYLPLASFFVYARKRNFS